MTKRLTVWLISCSQLEKNKTTIRSAFMLAMSFFLVNMFYSIGGLLRQAAFSSQLL